jgi:hypothetical protein
MPMNCCVCGVERDPVTWATAGFATYDRWWCTGCDRKRSDEFWDVWELAPHGSRGPEYMPLGPYLLRRRAVPRKPRCTALVPAGFWESENLTYGDPDRPEAKSYIRTARRKGEDDG